MCLQGRAAGRKQAAGGARQDTHWYVLCMRGERISSKLAERDLCSSVVIVSPASPPPPPRLGRASVICCIKLRLLRYCLFFCWHKTFIYQGRCKIKVYKLKTESILTAWSLWWHSDDSWRPLGCDWWLSNWCGHTRPGILFPLMTHFTWTSKRLLVNLSTRNIYTSHSMDRVTRFWERVYIYKHISCCRERTDDFIVI